jgi:hypothetical protein
MQASVVTSIAGAPGNGAKSLSIAIRRQLASRGVAITGAVNGAHRVHAVVALGQASNGQQPVHIEWTVTDPVGKNLGNIEQFNDVPEELLDGAWGTLAQKAARGIAVLMPHQLVSRGDAITGVVNGAYRVQAVVTLGQASDGQQPVHIEWTVTDPVGKNLGNVEQFNHVREGPLDVGVWEIVAEQAVQGIAMLIPR